MLCKSYISGVDLEVENKTLSNGFWFCQTVFACHKVKSVRLQKQRIQKVKNSNPFYSLELFIISYQKFVLSFFLSFFLYLFIYLFIFLFRFKFHLFLIIYSFPQDLLTSSIHEERMSLAIHLAY